MTRVDLQRTPPIVLTTLGLLLAVCAAASGEAFIERATCYRAAGPIVVDGRLDEPSWAAVEGLGPFLETESAERPQQATTGRLLWDEEALYVALHARDADVWATIVEHDGRLWLEEVLEVFVDPDGDGRDYVEWEINPLGTQLDFHMVQSYAAGGPAITDWDPDGVQAAVFVDGTLEDREDRDRTWTGEWRIPWSVFVPFSGGAAVPPVAGDAWRIGLYRTDRSGGGEPVNSAWSPTRTPSFHTPERFGAVLFAAEVAAPGPALGLAAVRVDDAAYRDAGDGSGTPDPGERPEVWITVRNHAQQGAAGVVARLESAGPSTMVEEAELMLGDVGGLQETFRGPFRVQIAEDYEPGTPLPMVLVLRAADGRRWVEGIDLWLDDFRVPALALTGLVVDADGAPVEGATVLARPQEGGSAGTTVTDATGQFHLEVPEGGYLVAAVPPGAALDVAEWTVQGPVTAGAAQRLRIELPPYVEVGGHLTHADGMPVAAANLRLYRYAPSGYYSLDLRTAADGSYHALVPAGDVFYSVEAPSGSGLGNLRSARPHLTGSGTTLDLTLRPTVRVTGTVRGDDGGSVAGFLSADDPATGATAVAAIGTDGAYAIDLPTGEYVVRVFDQGEDYPQQTLTLTVTVAATVDLTLAAGARVRLEVVDDEGTGLSGLSVFASALDGETNAFGETGPGGGVELVLISTTYRVQFFANGSTVPPPLTLVVVADTTVRLQLPPAYPVSGRVTLNSGDGAGGITLQFVPAGADIFEQAQQFVAVEADGSFATRLAAGRYGVVASGSDGDLAEQSAGAVVVTTDGAEVDLVLRISHPVRGRISDAQGEPVTGGQVLVAPAAGGVAVTSADIDAEGGFAVDLVAGGYRLLVAGTGFATVWRGGAFRVPHPELLEVRQPGGAEVRGVVTDHRGSPAAGVVLLSAAGRSWAGIFDAGTEATAIVGPDGGFLVAAEPGDYSLIVLPLGLDPGVGTGRRVELHLDQDSQEQVRLELPSIADAHHVAGRVRSAGGRSGVYHGVFHDAATGIYAVARSEGGGYQVALPTGTYAVTAVSVGFLQDAIGVYRMAEVTVDGDLTFDLDLADAVSAVAETRGTVPDRFHLDRAFPNPFNAEVTIPFALPRAAPVVVTVYDILGQPVRRLRTGPLSAGWHVVRWDGRDEARRPAASGVYLYRMVAGAFAHTRRMTLVR